MEYECISDLDVLQVLYVGCLVAISLPPLQHPEAAHAQRVHEGATIREQLQGVDLQDAAVVREPAADTAGICTSKTQRMSSPCRFALA